MYCTDRQIGRVLTQTDDASNTLFSDRYQQTYHSTFGARTESLHVFLHGSGVHERLCSKQPTRVLEIGFGLGLNYLLCADHATRNCTSLSYTGIEHAPIDANAFKQLGYGQQLDNPGLAADLAEVLSTLEANNSTHSSNNAIASVQSEYTTTVTGGRVSSQRRPASGAIDARASDQMGLATGAIGSHTTLNLHINNATASDLLDELRTEPRFDAIFLDAFSPDVNPECWTERFFKQLSQLLTADGRLATYCVKGSVRRNLVAAGFNVTKYPGPKGKREVLWASRSN